MSDQTNIPQDGNQNTPAPQYQPPVNQPPQAAQEPTQVPPQQQPPMYQYPNQTPPPYQQPYQDPNLPQQQPGRGLAIASLCCGIASVILLFCCGLSIPLGILAVVFGFVARAKGCKNGMTIAGIVCGFIGFALYIVFILAFGNITYNFYGDPEQWFEQYFEQFGRKQITGFFK